MLNDKQRFGKIVSGEEIWCGGQSRGCLVGKLLSPVSQAWQQGPCTHARHPFALQKGTGSEEEAGDMSIKNVHGLTLTVCHLYLYHAPGAFPAARGFC